MDEITQLQQQLAYARTLGKGLSAVLTSLFVAHVKQIGGDREGAISKTRAVLDQSVSSLVLTGTTTEGEKADISSNVHRGITRLLNEVEVQARQMLGQASGTSKAQ